MEVVEAKQAAEAAAAAGEEGDGDEEEEEEDENKVTEAMMGTYVPGEGGKWASTLRVVDCSSGSILDSVELQENEAAVSIASVPPPPAPPVLVLAGRQCGPPGTHPILSCELHAAC